MIIPNIWTNKKCSKPPTRKGPAGCWLMLILGNHEYSIFAHHHVVEDGPQSTKLDPGKCPGPGRMASWMDASKMVDEGISSWESQPSMTENHRQRRAVFHLRSNVGIAIKSHPPFITINGWYKPPKMGWLSLLYPHYKETVFFPADLPNNAGTSTWWWYLPLKSIFHCANSQVVRVLSSESELHP